MFRARGLLICSLVMFSALAEATNLATTLATNLATNLATIMETILATLVATIMATKLASLARQQGNMCKAHVTWHKIMDSCQDAVNHTKGSGQRDKRQRKVLSEVFNLNEIMLLSVSVVKRSENKTKESYRRHHCHFHHCQFQCCNFNLVF